MSEVIDLVSDDDEDDPKTPAKAPVFIDLNTPPPCPRPAPAALSIGTDSPLVPKRKTEQPESLPKRTVIDDNELIEALRGFKEAMEESHSTMTYYKLHDAKRAIEDDPNSQFIDKADPFASMKSVQVASTHAGIVYEKADYWAFNNLKAGKFTKIKTMVLATTGFDDRLPRVPGYQSYINVRRNILSADDENLKYIPYLGDRKEKEQDKHHEKLKKELENAGANSKERDDKLYERAHKLRMWLISWLKVLNLNHLDLQSLKHYALTLPDTRRRVKKATGLESLRGRYSLDKYAKEIANRFSKAFREVFGIGIGKVVLPKEQLKEMIDAAKRTRPSTSIPHRLSTYTDLTCMICGVVDCSTHGRFTDDESSDQDSNDKSSSYTAPRQHADIALSYPETLARYRTQRRTRHEVPLKNVGPCSEGCYMAIFDEELQDRTECELEQETIDKIHDMMIAMDDPTYQSCHIAFCISIPCWQVHIEVAHYIANSNYLEARDRELETQTHATAVRPVWYDNKRKTISRDMKDATSAHIHETRLTSESCRHKGPCDKTCPCTTRNILCERFCTCADDCPRRFTGCSCHGNGFTCTTDHCICIAMNRECGPECGSCGALGRINPQRKHEEFTRGCLNVPLQRGVSKKILMGESQLAGFGVYMVEPARKGEYIGEYTGEMISSAEAERRGIIYDRKRMSFLFDLNASYVIDAAKMGNLTRFINHASSTDDGLNCEAKIVLVNGEHRIKFLALRDIAPGEELLFNYGRKFAEKHGLNVKLKLPTAKKVKGVLIGEEAMDALDGLTTQQKMARGQMKAGRGRGLKKSGRKAATKSAKAVHRKVAEADDDDMDVDVEDASQEAILKTYKGRRIIDDDDFEGPDEEDSGSEGESAVENEPSDDENSWSRRSTRLRRGRKT